MKQILINATAAKVSGALTVLKDLLSFLYNNNYSEYIFHVFTSTNNLFLTQDNVIIHELPVQNWKMRMLWDKEGLQNWCIANTIEPDLIISLQNTCSNYSGIPQLVYYHQSLPLIPYFWNPIKKSERVLFLYAHFYKFFVNKFNKNAWYVVQLPYIKKLFAKKFRNVNENDIYVIRPNSPNIDVNAYDKYEHKIRFIYPATPLTYKNHKIILCAVKLLKKKNPNLLNNTEIIFTCDKMSFVGKLVKKFKLDDVISCIGSIPYDNLMEYYRNSEVLLFPSKIETYGLPLIEASKFGLKIFASALPYAKEVLENYNNTVFINPNDKKGWANEIEKCIMKGKCILTENNSNKSETNNSWKLFFDIVTKQLQVKEK